VLSFFIYFSVAFVFLGGSAESGQRANIRFDSFSVGVGPLPTLTVKWLFALSWLETTHVSENLRLGRGNKGSIFVLTR
jgi:hypothetical protein